MDTNTEKYDTGQWTDGENAFVMQMIERGYRTKEISELLHKTIVNRSVKAISNRATLIRKWLEIQAGELVSSPEILREEDVASFSRAQKAYTLFPTLAQFKVIGKRVKSHVYPDLVLPEQPPKEEVYTEFTGMIPDSLVQDPMPLAPLTQDIYDKFTQLTDTPEKQEPSTERELKLKAVKEWITEQCYLGIGSVTFRDQTKP